MKFMEGGVTAARGFLAAGVHSGIRKNKTKPDLAMIFSEKMCAAAGVFTRNLVKSAPVYVSMEHLKNGRAQAVIANSGNANACNADGLEKAERMCEVAGAALGIDPADVVVASTGVIGQVLPIEPIESAAGALAKALSKDGSHDAAYAIMTTDTKVKEAAVETEIGGKTVRIGGISKGSGMIHPNMGTMLCFVTTDCAVSAGMIQKAVRTAADKTFNMISVDGDTSTNDTLVVLANGMAENAEITGAGADLDAFTDALTAVCRTLAKRMAADGEGATKLLVGRVTGAKTEEDARKVARSVISSALVKAAMFGEDANCGRVLCAAGYSGADLDPGKIDVTFESENGSLLVCRDGLGLAFDEELASKVLHAKEITVALELHDGAGEAEAFGCDLTYDYVKINGDYRT